MLREQRREKFLSEMVELNLESEVTLLLMIRKLVNKSGDFILFLETRVLALKIQLWKLQRKPGKVVIGGNLVAAARYGIPLSMMQNLIIST